MLYPFLPKGIFYLAEKTNFLFLDKMGIEVEYKIKKQCAVCNNIDEYSVTLAELAFNHKDHYIAGKLCTKCGSEKFSAITYDRFTINQELLDIWGQEPSYYFNPQDEDLILAEPYYIPLFLNAIDNNLYPKKKLGILVSALCILVYDHSGGDEEYTEVENEYRKEIINQVVPELQKRKQLIFDLQNEIMDYIKERVFPLIGLKI